MEVHMAFFLSSAFLKTAAVSAVIFIALDLLWLAVIARPFYLKHFGYLASVENGRIVFNMYAGIMAQAVISLAITSVISLSINTRDTLLTSVIAGALSGFALYATYDLTNLSFVKGYGVLMSIVDIAWGTMQGIFAGFYVYYLTQYFS
jgi:uncharacterized membrane protein